MSGRNSGRGNGRNAPGRGSGRGGRGSGRYSGRGTSSREYGYGRGYAVGKSEADSVKYYEKMIITTNANINFIQLWKGAKTALQNQYGDATKVLLRMDVDTEDPDPGPAPEMPRRSTYGNEIDDEREYLDDMNLWREAKQDHAASVKEYKNQKRELNQKLEQIKNVLLSKCDADVREYLEHTHTRDVLYHTDTPVTAVMDYIEAASMRGEGIDKRDLKRQLTRDRNAIESDESMMTTETLLEYKNRIKAFSNRYNMVFADNPMTEIDMSEAFLNGLDQVRYGGFHIHMKNKQLEKPADTATQEDIRRFEVAQNIPQTLQTMYDQCIKYKSGYSGAHESHGSTYAVDDDLTLAATGGGNKTKPKKKSQQVPTKVDGSLLGCWLCNGKGHHAHNCKHKKFAQEQIKKKVAAEKAKSIDPELLKSIATSVATGNSVEDGISDYCFPMIPFAENDSQKWLAIAAHERAENKVVLHLWDTGSTLNLTPYATDLYDLSELSENMPLRTGNGVNNGVKTVGSNPLFGRTYVLESLWVRILSPGLILNSESYTTFYHVTTGEIDLMHLPTGTLIKVRWNNGVLVAMVPVDLYERYGVTPEEATANIAVDSEGV